MTTLDERIRDLVAHAYAKSAAIKGIMDDAGVTPDDIKSAADLPKIPVTSKDKLNQIHADNPPFGGFLTIDPDDLPRIYISPGTIFDPQPPNPDGQQRGLAPFRYVGFERGDRVLNTFLYHLVPAGLLLDEALVACGATVIPTGPGNTDYQIEIATKLGATGFVGQPSYLGTILDRMAEMGIAKEDVKIKKALFSAEPYTFAQKMRFEGDYGMKTTSAYGTADLGLIAYTMDGLEGFRIMSTVYVEICDPNTGEPLPAGETGEVVVTTFNKGYPLVRFGTGDLGAIAGTPDALTEGDQQLLGLYGRSGGAIKVRGMFLHPDTLARAKGFFPQIKHLQAVITRPENKDVLTLKLELREGESGDGLPEQIQMLAQTAARLRIDEVVIVPAGEIDPNGRAVVDAREWD